MRRESKIKVRKYLLGILCPIFLVGGLIFAGAVSEGAGASRNCGFCYGTFPRPVCGSPAYK